MSKFSPSFAAQLIEQHRIELSGYLIKNNHAPDVVADILQDAYIRLVNIKSDTDIKNPRAFLYKIVSNLAIDYYRRNIRTEARKEDSDALNNVPDATPSLERQLYSQEKLIFLQQVINELPPKCQQVFIMHKFKHYPYSKIKQELGISESTIVKHMVKAMRHCRERMQTFN